MTFGKKTKSIRVNFVPDKRPNVALVGRLEELVVLEPVLLADDDWRVARLHQDEVHEQPGVVF